MTVEERQSQDQITRSDIMGWHQDGVMQRIYNQHYLREITNGVMKNRADILAGIVTNRA